MDILPHSGQHSRDNPVKNYIIMTKSCLLLINEILNSSGEKHTVKTHSCCISSIHVHTQLSQVRIKSTVYRLGSEKSIQPLPLGYLCSGLPRKSYDTVSPWNCWNPICQNSVDPTLPRCAELGWWSPLDAGVRRERKSLNRMTLRDFRHRWTLQLSALGEQQITFDVHFIVGGYSDPP